MQRVEGELHRVHRRVERLAIDVGRIDEQQRPPRPPATAGRTSSPRGRCCRPVVTRRRQAATERGNGLVEQEEAHDRGAVDRLPAWPPLVHLQGRERPPARSSTHLDMLASSSVVASRSAARTPSTRVVMSARSRVDRCAGIHRRGLGSSSPSTTPSMPLESAITRSRNRGRLPRPTPSGGGHATYRSRSFTTFHASRGTTSRHERRFSRAGRC